MDAASQRIFKDALQTWMRIEKRFNFSKVWKQAPKEVIAAEFLSVLRFALAPRRAEIALYLADELIASTQPKKLVSKVDGEEDIEVPIEQFFKNGRQAIEQWQLSLSEKQKKSIEIDNYSTYFSKFGAPGEFKCKNLALSILVAGDEYDEGSVRNFIKRSKIASLLTERGAGNTVSFASELRPLVDGLTDHLLEGALDRLENDLAIVIDGDAPDIWLVLADGEKQRLSFSTSREKRKRLAKKDGRPVKIGDLRAQVDGTDEPGAFGQHLAKCDSGDHLYLNWNDDNASVTPEHLACLAEKFTGWPMDTGIAGTVVSTGCGEVLRKFADDYRVVAYSDLAAAAEKFDEFYVVQLAERVFINRRDHLIEIPLLWSVDEGITSCAAILLVTFDKSDHDRSDYARHALQILGAIEPWYLLFEQHGRLVGWNRWFQGQIMHLVNNASNSVSAILKKEEIEKPEALRKLDRLWPAYAFIPDHRGMEIETLSASDFVGRLKADAEKKIKESAERRGSPPSEIVADVYFGPNGSKKIQVILDVARYMLPDLINESSESVQALHRHKRIEGTEHPIVYLKGYCPETDGKSLLVLDIKHRAVPSTVAYIEEYGSKMGRSVILTESDGSRHAHQGLYLLRKGLDVTEAEFLRPKLDASRQFVTWTFRFPFYET